MLRKYSMYGIHQSGAGWYCQLYFLLGENTLSE